MAVETPTWKYKLEGDKQTASEMNQLAQSVIANAIELSNVEGLVTNLADDDDLENTTINDAPVIREKTIKSYNPENYSGMGKVVLRKSMVNGVNVLTQEMINQANTIYKIRYDFNLNGQEITIPKNCILKFEGGSLSDGTLVGTYTKIIAPLVKILDLNLTLQGTWGISECYPEWFGGTHEVDIDNSVYIQKALSFSRVNLNKNLYKIANGITLTNHLYNGSLEVLSTIQDPIPFVIDASNMWGSRIKDINIKGNNKTLCGIYASKGQNTNLIDNISITNCIEYGMDLDNCYLGYYSNIFVHRCGTGIRMSAAHNTVLTRAETKYCNIGIKMLSGGDALLHTIDTSYNNDTDIVIEYCGAIHINTWYTEGHAQVENSSLIKMSNFGNISLTNVIAVGADYLFELVEAYTNSTIKSIICNTCNTSLKDIWYNPSGVSVNTFTYTGANNNDIITNSTAFSDANIDSVTINNIKSYKGIRVDELKLGTYSNLLYTGLNSTGKEFGYTILDNITTDGKLLYLADRPYFLNHIVFITVTYSTGTYKLIYNNGTQILNEIPPDDFAVATAVGEVLYIQSRRAVGIIKVENVTKSLT